MGAVVQRVASGDDMNIATTSALARIIEANGVEQFGTGQQKTFTLLDARTIVTVDWSSGQYKTTMQPCSKTGEPRGYPMYWRVDGTLRQLGDTLRDLLVLHHTSIFTGR